MTWIWPRGADRLGSTSHRRFLLPGVPTMLTRRMVRFLLVVGLMSIPGPTSRGDETKPFVASRNAAEWATRRPDLLRAAEQGIAPRRQTLRAATLTVSGREVKDGLTVETVSLDGSTPGVLVLPVPVTGNPNPVPLVLLASGPGTAGRRAVEAPGFDGPADALVLARFGFAVLALDGGDATTLRMALDAALARPEVDPRRLAVIGIGAGGPTALALMAVDDRVRCGFVSVEADAVSRPIAEVFGSDAAGHLDATTWPDTLVALCAPRPLGFVIGENLPLRPDSAGKRIERAAKGTYRLASPNGSGLSFTHTGEFPGHASIATRLQWMAALEHLDKTFRPQGPVPLGHTPEPEPEVGPQAMNLSEQGIAGWAVEMSQRPETWTWSHGVIACKPGPNEYGWLRAPVEVGDFLLRIEWRVPAKGNAGIFLRANPVPWEFAPGEAAKMRVGALGLDWPSRSGLELQAQDDPGSANRYSSGSLYRHAPPASNPTHPPATEWNRYTVRARGARVEVWSNGVQVLDTRLDAYPETLPHPPMRGYIGLQNHGAPAEYRNVRLERLSD